MLKQIERNRGTLDFHTHPHDDDCVPSKEDKTLIKRLKKITGQETSKIVTPNGRKITFNEHGVVETSSVSNPITEDYKKALIHLFGGK